jgi:hypothetical protein
MPVKFDPDIYADKAHSNLLEILVTTGLVGFVIYLLLIVKTVNNLAMNKEVFSKILLLSLVLYIFHSQTNVISISEEVVFWLIIGVASKKIT